jgi:hypothetical protein
MRRCTVCLALIFLVIASQPAHAQGITWNSSPQKGFVFQLTNTEAQRLLTHKVSQDAITKSMLHTVIDTFDITAGWIDRPAKGHFILATVVANKLHCEYTSVSPYQVFLLKEYDALALQVLDHNGTVRTDARVKLKARRIQLDRETNTYRMPNGWFAGDHKIVTVELDGFRSVFNVQKHGVPDWYDDYSYDDGPSFYSYMITDKNKYKPGEKVRFKSYALSQSRLQLRKDLEVHLVNGGKVIRLGVVVPHRPGSYASEFILHDSLNLTLDKNYELQLVEKKGRIVSSCHFKYEEYELNGNTLDVRLATAKHYYPAANTLTILAADVNGLTLKDATASIVVITHTLRETFQPLAILPDTLMNLKLSLRSDSTTKISIPSSLFQKTNTVYEVRVTVLNTQNQRLESNVAATHYYAQYELVTSFSNDSLIYEILDNGMPMTERVPMQIQHNNDPEPIPVMLPYREKINPAVSSVRLSGELLTRGIAIGDLDPELELTGGIRKDSFQIELYNPQQLEVSWYIYQGSTLLHKGFGKVFDHASLITDRSQTYYVEVLYSFGGQERLKRNTYEFKEAFLDVSIGLPERVYPGQQVQATIQVNNQLGQPVSGVDLTAVATTAKLNYYLPDLPYYGSRSIPRSQKAHYSKSSATGRRHVLNLDYPAWEKRLRLDTMKYYQFTYPGKKKFVFSTAISDSTQFAPFVMQHGTAKQIYVIEVNRNPVYYSWVDQPKAYSFYIPPNQRNTLTLRLHDRVLILDSLIFEAGKKTIISLDLDNLPEGVEAVPMVEFTERTYGKRTHAYYAFTETERKRYLTHLSSFRNMDDFAYLQSGRQFTPLFSVHFPARKSYIVVGPVNPGMQTFRDREHTITYQHSGGYHYAFEDNVVYKLTPENLLPEKLQNTFFDPLTRINDRVETKSNFLRHKDSPPGKWLTRVINLVDRALHMTVLLPVDKKSAGIAALLFEDRQSKKILSPCKDYYPDRKDFFTVPRGLYNVIVLYNKGEYLKMDSIRIRSNTHILIDLNQSLLYPADDRSFQWLSTPAATNCISTPAPSKIMTLHNSGATVGNVYGQVYDSEGLPVVGASVVVKGTTVGTITDVNGQFTLNINASAATLIISFIGYKTEEIEVRKASQLTVTLMEDVSYLAEVVVVGGYGSVQRRELGNSVTTALSGRVAGAMVRDDNEEITSDPKETPEAQQAAERQLYQELLALNTIRSNFHDVAFWEPRLYTDKQGQSKFNITFPDDITRWDAVVYAMNRVLQTGTARKSIRSYKPIMTELNVPQFLTKGDSALFIGNVLNYTDDKHISGSVRWSGARTDFDKKITFTDFHSDRLAVNPTTADSVTTQYVFTRDDGYTEGEKRTIPVVEQGTVRADGTLELLKNNEAVTLRANNQETVTLEILDNQLDIYAGEIRTLVNYKYACNEQLASKLLGLINYKAVMHYEGRPFRHDKDINKIIARLLKNQNSEFLWSWWDVSPGTSYWMSAHILRALKVARDSGYEVRLDVDNIARKAAYKFEFLYDYSVQDAELINALAGWGAKLAYAKHLRALDSLVASHERAINTRTGKLLHPYSFLKEKLLLLEARQLTNTGYQRDLLLQYRQQGILDEVYFSDRKPASCWYNDDLSANAIAYRVVRKDSALKELLTPMQLYFIGLRKARAWNTYQSSVVTTGLLPDLLAAGAKRGAETVTISGHINQTVSTYPFRAVLPPNEAITIRKDSGLPMYYMRYTEERVTEAKTGVEGFMIRTFFAGKSPVLKAGTPVALTVEIEVTKTAEQEYVMIEVPIPAACSYADKRQPAYSIETHREYFKDRTVIFCERMKPGRYTFTVQLLPRFTGSYTLNPAQVSLMYIPVVNANTDMKRVKVN